MNTKTSYVRNSKSSDPKKYWSILNRELDQNKDSTLPVPLIELLNHFKKLSFSGDITRESRETTSIHQILLKILTCMH